MSFSPSYDQQQYSSPGGASFSPPPPPTTNRNSNKPTGKGSRGPYKPRANKLNPSVGTSVSPQRNSSATPAPPKRVRPSKKKQKERSLSLEDDIDEDDLVDGAGDSRMNDAGLSRDDDYDEDLEGRAGSRSRSVMGGSRAGTPMGGGRRRESTMDGGREGTAGAGGPGLEEEEEEEDDEDEMGGGGAAGEAKEVKERLDEVKEAQMLLVDHMDKNQRARFDSWKTSSFPRAQMKKYIIHTTSHTISDELAQIVGGISKVYVGLIIRKAREVQQAQGHTGPLTPFHLREAHRLYARESRSAKRPGSGTRKKALFTR
ncbi:hTAFII28-like protein conserved region-domain-containing protein [Mrakia frigida]|uniref:TATA-binding protein-associated factor TAF11 n=1 Tax=Mrakia frigida TaxID=29902 RepID=UPI003FCBEFA2